MPVRLCFVAAVAWGFCCGCAQQAEQQTPSTPDSEETAESAPEAKEELAARKTSANKSNSKEKKAAPANQSSAITLKPLDPADFEQLVNQYNGKVLLVDFWATWCIPCVKQFPHTVAMHRQYADEGLAVVSISMDEPMPESKQKALNFLKKQGATFENRLNTAGISQKAFEMFDIGGGALPHYKIYDRDGSLVRTFESGDPDASFTHEDIEEAVRGALVLEK